MRHAVAIGFLAVVLAAGPSASLAFEKQGGYVGGGIGGGSAEFTDDAELLFSEFIDDDLAAAVIQGGYRFNPWIGIEGRLIGTANDANSDEVDVTFGGIGVQAIGFVPVHERFDLFATLGYYTGRYEVEEDIDFFDFDDDGETARGPTWGAGVLINLGAGGNFGIRLEYSRHDVDELIEEVDTVSASFQYSWYRR